MAKAVDPVCGMTVDTETAHSAVVNGETVYFCCPHCKAKYEAVSREPGVGSREQNAPVPAPLPAHDSRLTGQWTCPMHPEVIRDKPGACPICGMALEPRTVTLEEQPNDELIDMQRRFV